MLRKLERVLALAILIAILLTGCSRLEIKPDATVVQSEDSVESIESMLSSIGVIEDLSFEVRDNP